MANRPQSRAGDVTGRERERQQAEHATEIKAGAERLTMVNPPPQPISDTVMDMTGDNEPGMGTRTLSLDEIMAEGLTEIPTTVREQDISPDELSDGRVVPGMEAPLPSRPEEPQPTKPAGSVLPGASRDGVKNAQIITPIIAEKTYKILRVNEDLEEVTIGKGNTFTFLVNQYYKVTPEVWGHLNEKGFVYH